MQNYTFSKTIAMQRIIDRVEKSNCEWFFQGKTPIEKLDLTHRKFADKFKSSDNSESGIKKSSRWRKKGYSQTHIVWWYDKYDPQFVQFFLLVEGGVGVEELIKEQNLLAVRGGQKITIGKSYEMVHTTIPKSELFEKNESSWTWRMTDSYKRALLLKLRRGVISYPKNPLLLSQCLHSIYSTPGFRGIRKNVGDMVSLEVKHWHKLYPNSPFVNNNKLGYVQRLANDCDGYYAFLAKVDQAFRTIEVKKMMSNAVDLSVKIKNKSIK